MSPRLDQSQEQAIECTIELSMKLEDPFETARRLFSNSNKVNTPIELGDHIIVVRAALVDQEDLEILFEDERFAGIMARSDEQYQFINRELHFPKDFMPVAPKLMAFHCLAAIKVDSFGDETGTIPQYQAIALELAYAKSLIPKSKYQAYEAWRQTIERSDFFDRDDWRGIVDRTSERFRELGFEMQRNAHEAQFIVTRKGLREMFKVTPNGAVGTDGQSMPVFRKQRRLPRRPNG
jgi:hypothetical protein